MSSASVRRRVAELNATKPARQLAPELEQWLTAYEPRKIAPEVWAQISGTVHDAARQLDVAASSFGTYVSVITTYVAWAHERSVPLDPQALWDVELIEVHVAGEYPDRQTASTCRGRLKNARRAALGIQVMAPVPGAHKAVQPPYTAAEVAAMVRLVLNTQSTLGRQGALCLGLGLGAGVPSVEIRELRLNSIVFSNNGHNADVHIPGRHARVVPVLREYVPLLQAGVAERNANKLLIGKVKDRRNVAAAVYRRLPGTVRPDQGRLRSTWLARLMVKGIPLPTIMDAAGLTAVRTLSDLLTYVELDTDREVLR